MIQLPDTVKPLFIHAGWHPGRSIAIPENVPADHPAAAILSEFSGLHVGTCGEGEECAKADVCFTPMLGEEGSAPAWEALLRERLICIAQHSEFNVLLFVGATGRCFGKSEVHDAFSYEGGTFPEAIERILIGRCARPMLRPDQESVHLYGIEYRHGSSEILTIRDKRPS